MRPSQRMTRYLRWLYELTLSFYRAFVAVAAAECCFVLRVPLLEIDRWLAHQFTGDTSQQMFFTHTDFDPPLAFGMWWVSAVIIFVGLRLLGQFPYIRTVLSYSVGVVALAGPLYDYHSYPHFFGPTNWHLTPPAGLLWIETAAVVTYVYLYVCRKLPTKPALEVLVLVLHFSFWGLVIFGFDWPGYWWQATALLALPFLTSLMSSYYLRLSYEDDSSALTTRPPLDNPEEPTL